ncbi:mCG147004 [Mus musculus]|uniref:Uncharacterized protein n=1 Tax=Mus musculus TaxID=10090 RepID=Q9D4M2_MOUSE|nr:mCG147004 [Mus musculus]BAB30229.1 unnamed protein product [Mus musculus]
MAGLQASHLLVRETAQNAGGPALFHLTQAINRYFTRSLCEWFLNLESKPPSHVPVLLLGGPSLLMVSSLRRPETLLEKSESVAGPSAGILDTSPQFILLA